MFGTFKVECKEIEMEGQKGISMSVQSNLAHVSPQDKIELIMSAVKVLELTPQEELLLVIELAAFKGGRKKC
jgi:hypothetical protein